MAIPKKRTIKKIAVKKSPSKKPAVKKKISQAKRYWPKLLLIGAMLILLSPLYYGYVLKAFVSGWEWVRYFGQNPKYRTYKSFNIRIPTKYNVHGIDVSYAQGKIDWPMVKAMSEDSVHISFAFVKATEGLLGVDPFFTRNWREAPKVGIVCGAYHFFRSNKSGVWQARFFLQNVKMEAGDLPPVADVETLDGVKPGEMRKQLQDYLTYIGKHAKVKPIIYTHLSFYRDYLAGYFDSYPTWIAYYDHEDLKVGNEFKWWFWQHSDKATITGINHVVDFNAFSGDSLALSKLLLK